MSHKTTEQEKKEVKKRKVTRVNMCGVPIFKYISCVTFHSESEKRYD